MPSTPRERLIDKSDAPKIGSDKKRFWDASEKLRSELRVAGFWDALEQNCKQWADDVTVSPFWKAVKDRQSIWSNEFQRKTSGALLANPGIPPFVPKTINRAREKLLHEWIRANRPGEVTRFWADSGPPIPMINDLVRTRIECQFLDGVEFFSNRLEELASELGIQCERQRQGRLVGYFAQHFYFEQKVIFRFGGGEQLATVLCEVQIATALASRIWEESHRTYEEWRVQTEEPEEWQWNPADPRFTAHFARCELANSKFI